VGYPVFIGACGRGRGGGDIMKAIELKNTSFSYDGKTKILNDVNFYADYGEVALVSGHSGSGKSTLISIISGIIPNVVEGELSGDVLIDGADIKNQRLGQTCKRVGITLQNADEQIIQKTVEDEVAFGCENLAFPVEKIKKQVEIACRIMKINTSWPTRTLSGGQKQRLITASTLAMGQKIIILDEPLANLDKEGAFFLMQTLRSLSRAGFSIIVVEHRLDMVLPFVDRAWHVGEGKVEEVNDKEEYLSGQVKLIPDCCPAYKAEEKTPVLSVKNAAFAVKGREILKGVSFNVSRGERVLLLGENGCGKTTLMRLIARLSRPTGGEIIQNIDPALKQKTKGSRRWYKSVGVVYQNPDYQLFMPTVRSEIEFGAISKEYAEEIGELFSLTHLFERHPQSLSEGQKRLVSIAAVCASKPKLLLLDEPTVGQDYKGLMRLVDILNKLHMESGNTMITVTHDVRCAEALCDRAVLIEGGTVKEDGGKEIVRRYFGQN